MRHRRRRFPTRGDPIVRRLAINRVQRRTVFAREFLAVDVRNLPVEMRNRIARRIEQVTQNVFKVNAGSLLTALQRLERNGWLDAGWQVTEKSRRAKVYRLTQTGKKQLQSETEGWQRRSAAISRLLKAQV